MELQFVLEFLVYVYLGLFKTLDTIWDVNRPANAAAITFPGGDHLQRMNI
jgi:hypothetical protein